MPNTELDTFQEVVDQIQHMGYENHKETLIDNATINQPDIAKSIKQLPELTGKKKESAIVISAGPSVHKQQSIEKIKESGYEGTIISADGAYIACLKKGLIPDYVITLDPHLTRIVRWFGDHDFEKHSEKDDYFARQDLDIEFRKNTIKQNEYHIELVNEHGSKTKALVASVAPPNVVQRLKEAKSDMYWWNPLVDNPREEGSITRKLYDMNKLICMNTGGTVGTAGWVFADTILDIPRIGMVGMDYGYYKDTPIQKTQTYYELLHHLNDKEEVHKCFVDCEFPLDKKIYYTDPTYFWYRRNFLDLLSKKRNKAFNCTEGGTLFGEDIECMYLDKFLEQES